MAWIGAVGVIEVCVIALVAELPENISLPGPPSYKLGQVDTAVYRRKKRPAGQGREGIVRLWVDGRGCEALCLLEPLWIAIAQGTGAIPSQQSLCGIDLGVAIEPAGRALKFENRGGILPLEVSVGR